MKKVIIAFISGALVMASGQAVASTVTKVGKKIDSEAAVYVNGEQISDAVISEGKSYAPVRDLAEYFGAKVAYQKGAISIDIESNGELIAAIAQKKSEIAQVEYQINKLKTVSIPGQEDRINHPEKYDIDSERFGNNQELARKNKEMFETQLAELTEKLEKLNTELDQLTKESAG